MTKKAKKYVEENPKTMLLIKSAFGSMKSFKMIPIHNVYSHQVKKLW